MKVLRNNQQNQEGQSLVEFAITLPIIVLILSGLLDLGRAYYTFIALEEAAAEGALYLAIDPECAATVNDVGNTLPNCGSPNNALYRAETSGNGQFDTAIAEWNIPYTAARQSDPTIWRNPEDDGCNVIGCTMVVQVRYPYDFLTPGMETLTNTVTNGQGLILEVEAYQLVVFTQR